jgi:hypothetical protein
LTAILGAYSVPHDAETLLYKMNDKATDVIDQWNVPNTVIAIILPPLPFTRIRHTKCSTSNSMIEKSALIMILINTILV